MQNQINPKMMAIIIGVVVIVILGIGYKLFFTTPVNTTPKFPKSQQYLAHPTGGEAYHNPQGLGLPAQPSGASAQPGGAPGR